LSDFQNESFHIEQFNTQTTVSGMENGPISAETEEEDEQQQLVITKQPRTK
jgi:hypothetical protein